MAEEQKEQDAFLALFSTFELDRQVMSVSDLSDGAPLLALLQVVDPEYFRSSHPSTQGSDNWVLRFSSLKRLYRLMTQYYADVLHQPTSGMDVPDLQAMAKDHDPTATLAMCRLTIAIAVQSSRNKEIIDKIQGLSQEDQHCLMKAIEQSMSKLKRGDITPDVGSGSMNDDDHYYQIQTERSRILAEKETLESVYRTLLEEHRTLQTNFDDAIAEKEEAISRLRELNRERDDRRSEKADSIMRAEIDRLRTELQKSEDNLSIAETELERHRRLVEDLHHKVDELQVRADEAIRLKDQVDEYRHAAEKLQKTENVMEKYKKKLEESADLRRRIKALEEQNASLVDKNASLEEEYRKVSAFKPLLESYKYQISELEAKGATKNKEIDSLKFELEQARTLLKISAEERQKDSEALELYQERVRELELISVRPISKPGPSSGNADSNEENAESLASPNHDEDATSHGLGGELDDALSGRTTTDLKLEIRRLKRELEAARSNQADNSRILVLENLLDDANRMKARYESDYLAAHREKLVMQKDLEEIRSGKSLGDGAEAAIALRQRLNETVDQLDDLRKEHAELEVNFQNQSKELTIAKSDLNLVNKDQLEILSALRESVNEDKAALEAEVEGLQSQIKELSDKNRMQLEQINGLLLEKISLQSEGIGQREKMLERERNFSELRLSINGKDVPEDVKARLLKLHEENITLKEQLSTAQSKLAKAKNFIKQQDKLFRAENSRSNAASPGMSDDLEAVSKAQVKIFEDEIDRYKKIIQDMQARYDREQRYMLSVVQRFGEQRAMEHLAGQGGGQQQKFAPTSWLAQQRAAPTVIVARRRSSPSLSINRLPALPASSSPFKVDMALFKRRGNNDNDSDDSSSEQQPKKKGGWRRPANTAFKQQRLKAWQPILTPKTVLPTLFIIGILFGPIGGLLIWGSSLVSEITLDYTNCDTVSSSSASDPQFTDMPDFNYRLRSRDSDLSFNHPQYAFVNDSGQHTCILRFDIPADLPPTVLLYYKLTNFYQNHRRYVKSLNTDQLKGDVVSYSDLKGGDCKPLAVNETSEKVVYPCGLIANSIFNDTIYNLTAVETDGSSSSDYDFSYKGIAWPGEAKKYGTTKYSIDQIEPPQNWRLRFPNGYNESNLPNLHEDEHFHNWMRTSGLPTFTKLYGRNDDDTLRAGTYELNVTMDYPVKPYDGTKAIVITTVSWIGGKNPFLGWAYVAAAATFVVMGILGLIRHLVRPRRLGDMSLLSWSR
ncbi:hypothetical protein ACEPAH_4637 [Sanghuangporus vaninii]